MLSADDTPPSTQLTLRVSRGWINSTHQTLVSGWQVYNITTEFKRQGVPDDQWRITKVNEKYGICDTYPNMLVVPKGVSDATLVAAAKFRSKGRLPVFTWR